MSIIVLPRNLPSNPTQIHLLYREKLAGGDLLKVAHAGIEFLYPDGQRLVLHRTPDNNTYVSTYAEFASGQNVQRTKVAGSIKERMQRAYFCLQQSKEYNALFANCEHLTSFVINGESHSKQLQAAALGAGVSLAAACTVLKDSPWWLKVAIVTGGTMAASYLSKEKRLPRR